MPVVSVDGVDLDYLWLEGTGAPGPVLVFLHEGLGSISQWKDFPARLVAETGLPALIYARQGHGWSAPLSGPRPVDYLHHEARTVLPAVLAQFGLDRPFLIGHSDGASIALIYAAEPDAAVAGLILEAPHIFVEEITLAGIRDAVTAWQTTDVPQRLGRHHRDAETIFNRWHEVWLSPAFRDWNIEALLPRITAPTLLIQGRDDAYGSPEQIYATQRQVSGPADALLLPGCGHTPHREKAETVLTEMRTFVLEHAAVR